MSKSEEVNLALQMISATEKQIRKTQKDRIQVQAELSQLYIDVGQQKKDPIEIDGIYSINLYW